MADVHSSPHWSQSVEAVAADAVSTWATVALVVAHIVIRLEELLLNPQQAQHRTAPTSRRMAIPVDFLLIVPKVAAVVAAALLKLARLERELATPDLTVELVETAVKASQTRCVPDHPSFMDLAAAVRAIGQMATEEPTLATEAELTQRVEAELTVSTKLAVAAALAGVQVQLVLQQVTVVPELLSFVTTSIQHL